jgi:hypothetical protein
VRLDASSLAGADFDADGDVDADDLAVWQAAYNSDISADADDNGITNGSDFLIWQRQYTGDLSLAPTTALIPEPVGLILLLGLAAPVRRPRFR